MTRKSLVVAAALLGMTFLSSAHAFTNEPPGRALPGNYFAHKGQFYLRRGQYNAALEMFQLAGYWANKIAQYNVGVMYFNGIGNVPADRVLGTAWLGIAAEQHGELADSALHAAYDKLTPEERSAADGIFRQLDAKYGDDVALQRATKHYKEELRNTTGSQLGFLGHMTVQTADQQFETGDTFYADREKEFNAYLSTQFGHVGIGDVVPLPMPADTKRTPPSGQP
jgi:hypothetical protein